ncbi:DUF2515 family protein [Priestia koreensis]|uniref:DUF2515 family protein n=1 Tax=Priestia koreensis TaxID=284581 RepID=UPI0034582A27
MFHNLFTEEKVEMEHLHATANLLLEKPPGELAILSKNETALIRKIRLQTDSLNLNNLTRTNAYLHFFIRHPEIHWSLLAHIVSRNGGYHMTDLKGDLIKHLLSTKKKEAFFHFLERANALIFYDAYPQLLLYEETKRQQKSLFHLLPAFHASSFMYMMWNEFLSTKNASLLTTSLIVNEQHYIEQRLMHLPFVKKHVLNTWQFTLQEWGRMTYVLLPFQKDQHIRIVGQAIDSFSDLTKRIEYGKHLYHSLFHPSILKGACQFIANYPHTASRSDYSEQFFSPHPHSRKVQSPFLHHAWPNIRHSFYDLSDWFTSPDMLSLLEPYPPSEPIDITDEYYKKMTAFSLLSHH